MIFGIGLPRTGTNSLAESLRVLGFHAVHWQQLGEHVLDRWYESNLTVPDHIEALVDTCFTRWFRTADSLFPDSRFVLTTRGKDAWLASCDRWLSRITPAPGTSWFNRRIFNTGRVKFHRQVFADLYEEHHENVTRYFHGRDDLLVIDIAATADATLWDTLGQFVGRPAPDAPFPYLNRSTK